MYLLWGSFDIAQENGPLASETGIVHHRNRIAMALFPTPAAGFDHPLEILDGCHERVRRFSALAVRIAERIASNGFDDEARTAARSVMRYFDEAGPNHHRDEEDDLFPALGDCAPELVERLRAEHRQLEALWREVRAGLEAGTLAVALAESFTLAYRRHIETEERELLPLARRVLDERTIAKLGRAMAVRRGVA